MRIAIVADTHLPRFGPALPPALERGIADSGVGLILHAGDWTDELALDLLLRLAPVEGVAGNNDGAALQERFGTRRVVEVEGVRIGLTHGHLGTGRTTPDRALATFAGQPDLDAIVFGHSHIPLVRRLDDGRWLVNPGSPTDKRRQPAFTWALMSVEAGRIEDVRLVAYPDRRSRGGPGADGPSQVTG